MDKIVLTKEQARDVLVNNLGKFFALAQECMEREDETNFFEAVEPLGVAILGSEAVWQAALAPLWRHATDEEGYNRTFELLGVRGLPSLTFKQFQATGRDVPNLQDVPEAKCQLQFDEAKPGRLYMDGGLFIEKEPDGTWFLVMENDGGTLTNDLEELELKLYDWHCAEYDTPT